MKLAPAEVELVTRADGSMLLRSPQELGPYSRCVTEWLAEWSGRAAVRVFLAERKGEGWRKVSYREAYAAVRRIGQALLDRGLGAGKPVAILSGNGIDHALLSLGAMHVGVAVAPVSPAYALMSKDFSKLKYIFDLVKPALVFADEPQRFAAALEAVGATSTPVEDLLAADPGPDLERECLKVGPDTVAKILFTSGSTGMPRGVINSQRMLCANQQMMLQAWPFVQERPPVLVDWLPWNHTFGGNHNFNMVLRHGGTLYVDGGKPAPGLIETTIRNIKEISPTMYFNVPRGYDLLLPFLEEDPELRRSFFRELQVIFYAAAALPQNLWDRLSRLAREERRGGGFAMLSAWGSTETAPLATSVHFRMERPGVIGLPVAGCELKLVPSGRKLEARVRGANVTPGYYERPDLTAAAFDEEGFFRVGDAVKFADASDPAKGIVFDGRLAEDFKLSTGTWVHVGVVRVNLIAAADPLIQDAVIAGHDRSEVGALVFPSPAADGLEPQELHRRLAAVLRTLADQGGGSTRPTRLLVMTEPPSIDANEITDKGYLNQRAVLERRAELVDRLYAGGEGVIV
jgi:feruloyl-CoA synthase